MATFQSPGLGCTIPHPGLILIAFSTYNHALHGVLAFGSLFSYIILCMRVTTFGYNFSWSYISQKPWLWFENLVVAIRHIIQCKDAKRLVDTDLGMICSVIHAEYTELACLQKSIDKTIVGSI